MLSAVGFVPSSLVDYEPYVSGVVFFPGCNLRCGYCYNRDVVEGTTGETWSVDRLKHELARDFRIRGLDAVTVSGGEPLLYANDPEFREFLSWLRTETPYRIKLDTAGTAALIPAEVASCLDAVSLTLKPFSYYGSTEHLSVETLRANIKMLDNYDLFRELRITVQSGEETALLHAFDAAFAKAAPVREWTVTLTPVREVKDAHYFDVPITPAEDVFWDLAERVAMRFGLPGTAVDRSGLSDGRVRVRGVGILG